jgi:hypothetical protein
MANLILALTRRYFGFGDADDHVVLEGGRVIGCITLHPQAPEGRGTREQAMADFKARWQTGLTAS